MWLFVFILGFCSTHHKTEAKVYTVYHINVFAIRFPPNIHVNIIWKFSNMIYGMYNKLTQFLYYHRSIAHSNFDSMCVCAHAMCISLILSGFDNHIPVDFSTTRVEVL